MSIAQDPVPVPRSRIFFAFDLMGARYSAPPSAMLQMWVCCASYVNKRTVMAMYDVRDPGAVVRARHLARICMSATDKAP